MLPPARVRIGRPTDRLAACVAFYRDALGLPVRARFAGHAGYDGCIFDLPGANAELELTHHVDGSPSPAPTPDNLLVLYLPERADVDAAARRLAGLGFPALPPENPWWEPIGITVADPDGWRVVLAHDPA